jgi:hypothetical protein
MHIVEEPGDETIGNGHPFRRTGRTRGLRISFGVGFDRRVGHDQRSAWSLDGEFRNELKLAFIEKLEILLVQGSNGLPFGVAHDNRHQHQIDAGTESRRRIVRCYFGGGLSVK